MSSTAGIVSNFAPTTRPSIPPFSDGGIIAEPRRKPLPGPVMEERPIMVDPKTGERVYVDEWIKENFENSGVKFLNTLA